jgi:hypothetical protein
MKKAIIGALAGLSLAVPAAAAHANDELSTAIQEGQRHAAPADVKNDVGVNETEQAGEVGQHGEVEEVNEQETSDDSAGQSGGQGGGQGQDGESNSGS